MTWPATTIGELCPRPQILAFQTTFSALLHFVGGDWPAAAMPLPLGPRHCGQSPAMCSIVLDVADVVSSAQTTIGIARSPEQISASQEVRCMVGETGGGMERR